MRYSLILDFGVEFATADVLDEYIVVSLPPDGSPGAGD